MESEHPNLRATMLAALGNVIPTHLLDRKLQGQGQGDAAGGERPVVPLSRLRSV
jgi:hypothetical protein